MQHKQGSWNSAVEAVNKVSSCLYCTRLSFFPAVTRAVAVRNPYQAHTESGGAIVTFLIDGGHVFARGNLENFLKDFVFDSPPAPPDRPPYPASYMLSPPAGFGSRFRGARVVSTSASIRR